MGSGSADVAGWTGGSGAAGGSARINEGAVGALKTLLSPGQGTQRRAPTAATSSGPAAYFAARRASSRRGGGGAGRWSSATNWWSFGSTALWSHLGFALKATSAPPRKLLQDRTIRSPVAVAAVHQVLQAPPHVLQLREPGIDPADLRLGETSHVSA